MEVVWTPLEIALRTPLEQWFGQSVKMCTGEVHIAPRRSQNASFGAATTSVRGNGRSARPARAARSPAAPLCAARLQPPLQAVQRKVQLRELGVDGPRAGDVGGGRVEAQAEPGDGQAGLGELGLLRGAGAALASRWPMICVCSKNVAF